MDRTKEIALWAVVGLSTTTMIGCDEENGTDGGTDEDATVRRDGGRSDAQVADGGSIDGGTETDGGRSGDAGDPDGGLDCARIGSPPDLDFEEIAGDYDWDEPLFLTQPPGDAERLFVVEKDGYIRIIHGDEAVTTFLDIDARVLTDESRNELGLLGMAFHPDYGTGGERRFYVFYTAGSIGNYRNVIAQYEVNAENEDVADTDEVRLLDIADPFWNHNGGMLAFGPDDMLYAGMGDGGSFDDPRQNGQDIDTELGSLLRLDVENSAGDYVAAGNPYVGVDGNDRIWAIGLRNPWRFSFDRATGDLYLGDVGQDLFEEINFAEGNPAGLNYGWRAYEGTDVYFPDEVAAVTDHHEPVVALGHGVDFPENILGGGVASVIGGYVYRGSDVPGFQGWYVFGDINTVHRAGFVMCEGELRGLTRLEGIRGGTSAGRVPGVLVSFGEDNAGELYLVTTSGVYKIVAAD